MPKRATDRFMNHTGFYWVDGCIQVIPLEEKGTKKKMSYGVHHVRDVIS
jgi:hypothetical protein